MKAAKTLTVYLSVALTSQTLALAQNPLRAAPQDQYAQPSAVNSRFDSPPPPPRNLAHDHNAQRLDAIGPRRADTQGGTGNSQPVPFDGYVIPAPHDQGDQRQTAIYEANDSVGAVRLASHEDQQTAAGADQSVPRLLAR